MYLYAYFEVEPTGVIWEARDVPATRTGCGRALPSRAAPQLNYRDVERDRPW